MDAPRSSDLVQPGGIKNDFAGDAAAVHHLMRRAACDSGMMRSISDPIAALGRGLHRQRRVRRPGAQPAENRQLEQIDAMQVHLHLSARMRARGDQSAMARHRGNHLRKQHRVADVLEHHVDTALVGDAQDFIGQVLRAVVDAEVGPQVESRR